MRSRLLTIALHYLWAAALFGAGFWAVGEFGGGWVAWSEARGWFLEDLRFLWILAAIPLLLALRAHTLSDLPRIQQGLSLLLRGGLVAALVLALVGPEERDQEPVKTATVFVVDVSESVPDGALGRARAAVDEAWRRRGEHEIRLVTFAEDATEIPLPPGVQGSVPVLARPEGEAGRASNLQAATRLALTLLPADRLKRLVLVSDGLETRGSLSAELETARRFDVRVHYLDLTDVERPEELMVTGLDAPADPKPHIPFEVRGHVEATTAMKARCELSIDGVLATTEELELAAGEDEIVMEAKVKEGGDKRLALACTPEDATLDRFASNNRFEVPMRVPRRPRVLYVEGERRYKHNLLAALDRDFEVELRGARGVPSTLSDANVFDLIFVSDVPRVGELGTPNVGLAHMKTLESYVRGGGGLIWAGGEGSFGPGGYTGTWLERKVLPVHLDVQKKEDIPSLALVLVIDRSGSMSGDKLELAKQASRATLDVLQPSDKLGIIAFDSAPSVVVRLQRAANRLKITDSVRRLTPGGGTDIFPAVDMAYQELASTRAKVKHIILLSDGQSRRQGILDLVAQSYGEGITLSTVAVGMGSDQTLLMQAAEEGGGRYYFTDNAQNIPRLFLKEASEVTRAALVEDRFQPRVAKRFRRLQVFEGLDMKRAPPLLGYVSTKAKPRTEVLMSSHLGEPILARHRLGLGQSVVWTSDVKNKWAHFWLKWDGYAQLFRQLIRATLRVEKEDPVLATHVDVADGVLTVGVDAVDDEDRFIDALESSVAVTGPDGEEHEVPLTQTAPGRYTGQLRLDRFGPWTVRGTHNPAGDPDALHRTYAALAWPFATEHLVRQPDLSAIERMAQATGGVRTPTPTQLFDPEDQTTTIRVARWDLPLYLALILLMLDVLLRRVRLYGRTTISWHEVSSRS